jgi:hypothetical protein
MISVLHRCDIQRESPEVLLFCIRHREMRKPALKHRISCKTERTCSVSSPDGTTPPVRQLGSNCAGGNMLSGGGSLQSLDSDSCGHTLVWVVQLARGCGRVPAQDFQGQQDYKIRGRRASRGSELCWVCAQSPSDECRRWILPSEGGCHRVLWPRMVAEANGLAAWFRELAASWVPEFRK